VTSLVLACPHAYITKCHSSGGCRVAGGPFLFQAGVADAIRSGLAASYSCLHCSGQVGRRFL